MNLPKEELKDFLIDKAKEYAQYSFIQDDPIQIPHFYSNTKDIEVSGLIAATLSWGGRKTIIAKSKDLMERMDHSPSDFIQNANASDLQSFNGFVHRTFKDDDIKGLVLSLQKLYGEYNSIGDFFKQSLQPADTNIGGAFSAFKTFLLNNGLPQRASKHFGDPLKGSACKRLVMYARWMARPNTEGIDFGIWDIDPALLSIPLDVHSGRVARSLGLLTRKQSDWKAVIELDSSVRLIAPEDPSKLDYALFGLGVYEGWK